MRNASKRGAATEPETTSDIAPRLVMRSSGFTSKTAWRSAWPRPGPGMARTTYSASESIPRACANAVVGVVMTRELGRHIPLAVERHDVDQSCGTYSGKRLNASEQLLLQGPALFL